MVNYTAPGPVPSRSEVDKAIASLLGFWNGTSSERWVDAILGSDPRALISTGLERFMLALRLLKNEPAVKFLVISLVSDKAFWDAVLNNEAVRKVQELLITGKNGRVQISEDVDLTRNILSWFLEMLKDTIMVLIDKFKLLVIEMTQTFTATTSTTTSENKDHLEEKVRSSFLLSVVILFIVVLARMTGP